LAEAWCRRWAFVLSMSKLTVIMLQSSSISNVDLTINFTKKDLKLCTYDTVICGRYLPEDGILIEKGLNEFLMSVTQAMYV
jgi:hypothetical protein